MADIHFGYPDRLCPVESFDEEFERIRNWVKARLVWMDENLHEY